MALTDLLLRRSPYGDVLPTYGVWCRHHQVWAEVGPFSEKDAWWALLDTGKCALHRLELVVRRVDTEDVHQALEDEGWQDCSACDGVGTCPHCEQTCPACDGTGEVPVDS